jgi:CIC family chloride channel protein
MRRFLRNDQLVLLVLAILMGAVAAYGAIGFGYLYRLIQGLFFGTFGETLYTHAQSLPAWKIVAVPTIGGFFIGLFIHFFMPGGRPRGVADVMEVITLHSGRMDIKSTIGAAVVSAASVGVGGSVGREGPVVHLGAGLASWISRRLGASRTITINLLGCGAAAAISASFNAPIAGTIFALEVVIGHYALSALAPIALASVTGTILSRAHFGDFSAFVVPSHSIVSYLEFPAFALLGVVSALAAIILMKSIMFVQDFCSKSLLPRWVHPAIGGALIGLIALAYPQVLGVGYGATDAAMKEEVALGLLFALLAAKTAAVAISLGSGFAGGIFSPSLFLGAMLGGVFGIIATEAFPQLSSGYSAYTLVGMGAVAGAVLGAPLSTILIVFELTGANNYSFIIAVMVAVVIASVITQQAFGGSFFWQQLKKRGVNLTRGRETGFLAEVHIGDVMTKNYTNVSRETPVAELREKLQKAPNAQLFVLGERGTLVGTIGLADVAEAAFDPSLDGIVNAADITRPNPPVLMRETDLEVAIKLMEDVHEEHIAVVEDTDNMQMIGVVHEVDVMLAYNNAIVRAREEERGAL